jgi:hypothetical protein
MSAAWLRTCCLLLAPVKGLLELLGFVFVVGGRIVTIPKRNGQCTARLTGSRGKHSLRTFLYQIVNRRNLIRALRDRFIIGVLSLVRPRLWD